MYSMLAAGIDAIHVEAFQQMTAAEHEIAAHELCRQRARLEFIITKLQVAVNAGRSFRADGSRDAAHWIAIRAGERVGVAKARGELGEKLRALPIIEREFASGSLSAPKVHALGAIISANESQQERLAATARAIDVRELIDVVRAFNMAAGAVAPPVNYDVHSIDRGTHKEIVATLDHDQASIVEQAINRAIADLDMPTGTSWGHRAAFGLSAIARFFLEHVDGNVASPTRPVVAVTITLAELEQRAGSALGASSSYGDRSAKIRQLCCDANIHKVITGTASQPLDVGRATRIISPALTRELARQDRHCRWVNCRAKLWNCESHHVQHWADGGPTDLGNLVSLCWQHHHALHNDRRWQLRMLPGRGLRIDFDGESLGETKPPGLQVSVVHHILTGERAA